VSVAILTFDDKGGGVLGITFAGDWLLGQDLPSADSVVERIKLSPRPERLDFITDELTDWNTGFIKAVIKIISAASSQGITVEESGLPEGARRLLALAFTVKEREGARREHHEKGFFEQVGEATLHTYEEQRDLLRFTGELMLSLSRYLRGKATYLRHDLVQYFQEAGAEALPIVSLISFLIGMIFAFVGVKQLSLFGAGIYTADLVAVAMVREMAAIMTAIIMAGRTGAAYAAQIGTMKVNEEIDALSTLGVNPIDFLVTPRIIALVVMMPLLTMYSSLMGILGGTLVGLVMLDVSLVQYTQQTISAVEMNSLLGGLFKSLVYGSLVALAGCQQGMACGSSAMAVGQSTTRAVVLGIVLIVVSAAILTVIYINLGI
jgi:phospholipid/cholesterol/gamma-HCH transport system permease protein